MKNKKTFSPSLTARKLSPSRARKDAVGRVHFRTMASAATGQSRFHTFQKKLLNRTLQFNNSATQFAACLIAFDGIATKIDLLAALNSTEQPYLWHENTCLDWPGVNGRVNRRFLSTFTNRVLALTNTSAIRAEQILAELEDKLDKIYPSTNTSRLDMLLHDAQAWLMLALPGPLFAHCTSVTPLAAVPRSALAREETGKALFTIATTTEKRTSNIGFAQALDGYFSPIGKDRGSMLIHELVITCREKKSVADYLDKSRMLKGALALAIKAAEGGKITSLVIAFVIDLIESGGRRTENLSPKAIHNYVLCSAVPLFNTFRMIDVEQLAPHEFTAIYASIIDTTKPGNKGSTASALSAWHDFLQIWLDAPAITKSLYVGLEQPAPKSNMIWPHEIELIKIWMASGTCDERLLDQLKVALAISTSVRVRASELLKLRIRNILICQGGVEVEVSPMRRDGKLKTDASKRVMLVADRKVAMIISDWTVRRKQEGALMEDFIFGNPHSPSVGYKLGQLYVLINQLLKSVTGDPLVGSHTLSHTLISERFEKALLLNQDSDINPLDVIASNAGHASSQTSCTTYFHLFEHPLRYFIDRGILESIKFTSHLVSEYSGLSPEAFRQRCSRDNQDQKNQNIAWKAINSNQFCLLAESAGSSFALASATPPANLFTPTATSFINILNILGDLANGMSSATVSSRSNQSEEFINWVATSACKLLEKIGLLKKSNHARDITSSIADFQSTVSCTEKIAIQFKKATQSKFKPLHDYLSHHPDRIVLDAAVTSWATCFKRGYLNLAKPSHAAGLINLLYKAEMPIGRLIVCTCYDPNSKDIEVRTLLHQINSVFITAFPVSPCFDTKSPRRGRPDAYLVVSSIEAEIGSSLESAGASMAGFNSLIFAACVYMHWLSNPNVADNTANLKGNQSYV